MTRPPPWTSNDDAVLRTEIRRGAGWQERVAGQVGRSVHAVKGRGQLLLRRGEISAQDWLAAQRTPVASRAWTTVEDVRLRQLAPTRIGAAAIGRELGRSERAVNTRAALIGVRIARHTNPAGDFWQEWEDDYVRRWRAEGVAVAVIADRLGRGHSAVAQRLHILGIGGSKARPWSAEESNRLMQLRAMSVPWATVARRLNRSVSAVRTHYCRASKSEETPDG